MTVSANDACRIRKWLEVWKQIILNDQVEEEEDSKTRLLEPLKTGDPVFAIGVSRELTRPIFFDPTCAILSPQAAKTAASSAKRTIQCQVIFYLSKCPALECRQYVAATLPFLLWTEWILDEEQQSGKNRNGKDEAVNKGRVSEARRQFEMAKDPTNNSDLEAVEVALLAIYHQDLALNPNLPAPLRLQAVGGRSLYNPTTDLSSIDQSAVAAVALEAIQPDMSFQTTQLTLTKLDAYTRHALVLRLSRFYQDHLPAGVPYASLLAYLLLIDRLMLRGTLGDKRDDLQVALESLLTNSNCNEEDLSGGGDDTATIISATASLDICKDNNQPLDQISLISKTAIEMLWNIFYAQPPPTKQFPISEPLVLLWTEALCMATPYLRHPLSTTIRHRLMGRAKAKLYSTAVFALGRD